MYRDLNTFEVAGNANDLTAFNLSWQQKLPLHLSILLVTCSFKRK